MKRSKALLVVKKCLVPATLLLVIGAASAQWVVDGNNYTFDSTSATTTANNSITPRNPTSGVNDISATISSSDGSSSSGVLTSPVYQSNGSMFSVRGQGGGTNTAGAAGPSITFNNSASINLNIAGTVAYFQSQPGWAVNNPTYSRGPSSVINVISNGSSSTVSEYTSSNVPPYPLVPSDYDGADGGSVDVTVGPSGTTPIVLSLNGPTSGVIVSQYSGLPWQPAAAVINAQSNGGTASGIMNSPPHFAVGSGGSGGNVSVQTESGTTLQIGQIGAPVTGSIAGISAVSYGSPGAFCCSNSTYDVAFPYFYQQIQSNGPFYGSNYTVGSSGANGSAGNVTVENGALITAQNNLLPSGEYGTGIIGIAAASVGASMQINPSNYTPSPGQDYGVTTPSGFGGTVNVTNTGGIYLPGQSSIGILATSTADALIGPDSLSISGAGGSAGQVQVTNSGNITIGNNASGTSTLNNGTLSAGIVGVSSTGWLFKPFNTGFYAQMSAGNGGQVQITNSGSINTYGATSLGIAALSIGNSGLLVNNGNSSTNIYVGSAVTQNGANSTAGNATVTNSGNVTTQGATSVGILAAANGSGGLFNNNLDPVYGTPVINPTTQIQTAPLTSGVIMGSNQNAYTSDGGDVSVTNTGQVNTGISGGGGEASIGIVAQSVGGGGGNYTGTSALAHVGDAGGDGGDGGSVTIENSNGGSVSTINDGSIGILAQSVGGGGGNGANASAVFTAIGGTGGNGGTGGSVTFSLTGSQSTTQLIVTTGDYSHGLLGQSIGGGGGNGGYSKTWGIFADVGIGGSAGLGGSGGSFLFNLSNTTVQTSGDQSHGIILQSIGGGGGNGGAANSYTAGMVFGAALSMGGSGGSGGAGGTFGSLGSPLQNSGVVTTAGNDSMGLLLQSIGGGGGNGGSTLAKTLALSFPLDPDIPTIAFTSAIGGTGGLGGSGGNIYFDNSGTISTIGSNAFALLAQSVGGGGGNGGDSTAGANLYGNAEYTLNSSISLGGSGGVAGDGGQINISNSGSIKTSGNNAISFFAQSIGGGGGTGGSANATETKVTLGEKSLNLVLSLGGSGGAGGQGGDINLTNSNTLQTIGSSSAAVVAQSVGGGGGVGATAGTQGISDGFTNRVTLGGSGGAGGAGGTVTVTNTGNITTGQLLANGAHNPVAIGGDSHGIAAQSIAGGGGIGGSSDPSANLISNPDAARDLQTYATYNGIWEFFQSPSVSTFPKNFEANVAVGGNGGAAGDAETVTITNSGSINTIGHRAFGILAQSIGGGGGYGATVMNGSSAVGSSASGGLGVGAFSGLVYNVAVNVGGVGGSSSNGGDVEITQSGSISTAGYGSYAVLAQSIGGGGGYGADGSIVANTGFTGAASWNDGVSGGLRFALGSSGISPSLGSGGSVTYSGSSGGVLKTYGDNAVGILAQSIGGGGGVASGGCTNNGLTSGASACFASTQTAGSSTTSADFINQGQMMAYVINPTPGTNSSPSNGGGVNVNTSETINILGSGSIGVAAQSIGGGGGLILGNSANIQSATLPSMGVANGSGGSVTVTASNINLNASAVGSIGILAQSIGGGGGFLGDPNMLLSNSVPSYTASIVSSPSNNNASGGAVVVNTPKGGNIQMYGANQIGIFAQSIGAGGGVSSINGITNTQGAVPVSATQYGTGGTININLEGSIIDQGQQGGTVGIFAQSQGNSTAQNAQNITVTLGPTSDMNAQDISGYISAATGIIVSGGSNGSNGANQITLSAGSSVIVPQGNNAIVSINGTTNVTNYGTIAGGVNLGPTADFDADAGAMTNYGILIPTGAVIVSNNSLKNYGKVFVDGIGIVGETDVYGSYKQFSTGATYFDFNTTLGTNDYMRIVANSVSAGTMLQGGSFRMNRVDSNKLPAIGQTALLVTAQGGFLSSADGVDASTITISDTSPLIIWGLQQQGNNLVAQYQGATSNPAEYPLTKNQKNFIDYVVRAYSAGDQGADNAIGNLVSHGASINLKSALDTLNGAAMTIQQQTVVMTGNSMLGNALSCPTFDRNGTIYGETECVWGKYNGGQLRQAYSDDNPGYRSNDNTFSVGGQYRVASDTFVGASARFGQTNTSSTNFGATANVGDVSVGIKKLVGDYYLGVSGAFGVASQSNNRYSTDFFTGQNYNMTSHSNAFYGGIRARNAYQFNLPGNIYIKPYLDLDGLWIHTPSYQENGPAQAVPLLYSTQNSFNFISSPMVEIGGRIDLSSKSESWIRPFISAGAMFITNNTTNIAASIVGANSGTYQISALAPSTLFSTNAGIQVFNGEKVDIKLEYSAQAGQGFVGQSGTAKMNYRF